MRRTGHDFYRLLYLTKGSGTHTVDLITYELRPGSRFFLAPAPAEVGPAQQQIRQFGALLNQHYHSRHSVGDYAALLHVSANHLNAQCRRVLNKTASALIHERIITEAQRRLCHSALSVAQVAYKPGFEDASYFGRYFRKYTGRMPEAFRQRR